MKLLRIVPYASLALVTSVVAIAFLSDPELDFPFSEPPEGAALPTVDLGLGTAVLSGRIVDGLGEPISGAGVITKDGGRPVWTWTNANGEFVLSELGEGPRSVLVNALGFQATPFELTIESGTAEPVTLTLDRRIGPPPEPPGLLLRDLTGTVNLGAFAQTGESYELLFLPTTAPIEVDGGFPRRVVVEPDGGFAVDLLREGPYRVVLLSPFDRGAQSPDLFGDGEGGFQAYDHRADSEGTSLGLVSNAGAVRGVVLGPESRATGVTAGTRGVVRGALVRAERYAETRDRSADTEPREQTALFLNNEFRSTRTDRSGRYVLTDLAPGRYRVTIVAGRARRQSDVIVPAREAVDVNFETSR